MATFCSKCTRALTVENVWNTCAHAQVNRREVVVGEKESEVTAKLLLLDLPRRNQVSLSLSLSLPLSLSLSLSVCVCLCIDR